MTTCRKFISENPTFARPHDTLAAAYWLKGVYPEMLSEYKTYGELSGDSLEKAVASAMEEGLRSRTVTYYLFVSVSRNALLTTSSTPVH